MSKVEFVDAFHVLLEMVFEEEFRVTELALVLPAAVRFLVVCQTRAAEEALVAQVALEGQIVSVKLRDVLFVHGHGVRDSRAVRALEGVLSQLTHGAARAQIMRP